MIKVDIPLGQILHWSMRLLPLRKINVPIGQLEQLVLAIPENWPGGHGVQDVAPGVSENVLMGHCIQFFLTRIRPGLQGMQAARDFEPMGAIVPGGQGMQVGASLISE